MNSKLAALGRRRAGALLLTAWWTCAAPTASFGGGTPGTDSLALAAAAPSSFASLALGVSPLDAGLSLASYVPAGRPSLGALLSRSSAAQASWVPIGDERTDSAPAALQDEISDWTGVTLDEALPSAAPPVSTRYDSDDNVFVDMSCWDTDQSSLRMVYGNRADRQAAAPAVGKADEEVGIDLSLALGAGVFHARTERGLIDSAPTSPVDEDALTAFQYGYSANLGRLRYGADYALAGSEYSDLLGMGGAKPKRDHETTTLWTRLPVSRRVSLQASTEELRKDLGAAPGKPRYVDELTGLKAHFVLANRPYLGSSFWYQQGLRSADYLPDGQAYGDGDVRSSGAALEMHNGWSSHSFTTNEAVAYDRLEGWADQTVSQSLDSTLYPYGGLTLGITLTSSEDSTRSAGARWLGTYRSEALWARYSPPRKRFSLSWSGYSDGYSTLDGSTDYSESYTNLTVAFEDFSLLATRLPLALTLQFSAYADAVYSSQNTNDMTLWLRLGKGRPARPRRRERYSPPYMAGR